MAKGCAELLDGSGTHSKAQPAGKLHNFPQKQFDKLQAAGNVSNCEKPEPKSRKVPRDRHAIVFTRIGG